MSASRTRLAAFAWALALLLATVPVASQRAWAENDGDGIGGGEGLYAQTLDDLKAAGSGWAPSEGWNQIGWLDEAAGIDPGCCEYRIYDGTLYLRPLAAASFTTISLRLGSVPEELASWKYDSFVIQGRIKPVDNESFYRLVHLGSECTSIAGLGNVDTSNVTDMSQAFCGLSAEELDLQGVSTIGVTNMSYMFAGCPNLKTINLSGFDTSAVTDMSGMFANCFALEQLDLSGFDTSRVTLMGGLYAIWVPWFDSGKTTVYKPSGMFSNCKALKTLNVSSFDTSSVTDMRAMFSGCESLESLDVSSFSNSSLEIITDNRVGRGSYSGTQEDAYYKSMFGGCSNLRSISFGEFDPLESIETADYLFAGCRSLESIGCGEWDASHVRSMEGLFCGCESLSQIHLVTWDTSQVTDMSHMFDGCSSLASLDVSQLDTSAVQRMNGMFECCRNLESIVISDDFIGDNCSTVSELFYGCPSLRTIPSNFSFGPNGRLIEKSQCFYVDRSELEDPELGGVYCDSEAKIPTRYDGVDKNVLSYDWASDDRGLVKGKIRGIARLYGIPCSDDSMTVDISEDKACKVDRFAVQWFTSDSPTGSGAKPVRYRYFSRYGTWVETGYVTNADAFCPCENLDWGFTPGSYYFYRAVDASGQYDGYLQSNVVGPKVSSSNVENCNIDVAPSVVYGGVALTPTVTVKMDGMTLKRGSDYDVAYKNNVNVGTAAVFITGKGVFGGSVEKYFEITPASISDSRIVLTSAAFVYNGRTQKPSVKTVNGKTLVPGTDYDLEYSNDSSTDAGTYSVWVIGKGNYSGKTATAIYAITKAVLPTPEAKSSLVYNGKKRTGVAAGLGYTIKKNKATDAGSYTAMLIADKNHVFKSDKAKVAVKWKIAKASQKISAKNATVTAKAKKSGKAKALAKNVTVDLKKKAKVSAKTKVTYKKASKAGGKLIAVNPKTGKVTLKKGLKAGKYKVKVRLTAAASKNYKKAKAKTVTLTVTVK